VKRGYVLAGAALITARICDTRNGVQGSSRTAAILSHPVRYGSILLKNMGLPGKPQWWEEVMDAKLYLTIAAVVAILYALAFLLLGWLPLPAKPQ
jgi:hypothetical protein